jgi:hypothetical protein
MLLPVLMLLLRQQQQHIQQHKQGPLVLPLLMVLLALPGAMGSSLLAQRRQQPL